LTGDETLKKWECLNSDTGEDLAEEVREYHIPDISNWKNHDAFEKAFTRLEKDLRTSPTEALARQARIVKRRQKLWVAPASGGFNSASRRIGMAGERPELIASEKGEPHPPTVSGVTPETTRGTRVLQQILRVLNHLSGFPKTNASAYSLSVKQWMPQDHDCDLRRRAGWDCSCWRCAGR